MAIAQLWALDAALRSEGPILVVGDYPEWSQLLQWMLEAAGFTAETAIDEDAAIDRAGGRPPQLIVLDLWSPEAAPIAVRLRNAYGPDVPLLLLTAEPLDHLVSRLGATNYLCKPFGREHLARAVRRGLSVAAAS
jgi:DNA-binding response OmpR family regulator